jgi:hypothetical protein
MDHFFTNSPDHPAFYLDLPSLRQSMYFRFQKLAFIQMDEMVNSIYLFLCISKHYDSVRAI